MAGLPRKYAKMGFKKGWAAFRRSKSSTSKTAVKSRSIKRRTKTMAKKRRTYRRTSSTGLKPSQVLIGGGLYGALRAKISNLLMPVTSKVPLGTIGDEAVLFAISYYANKKMRDKTLKSVTQAAMAVEAARMGEAFADGSAFGNRSSNGAGMSFATLG